MASPPAAPVQDFDVSPTLWIIEGPLTRDSIKGRAVGMLVSDGADAHVVASVTKAMEEAGGKPVVITLGIGGAKLSNDKVLAADGQLAGTPSVMVDAVALIVSGAGCAALLKEAAAVQFVMDASGHPKAIGYTPEARHCSTRLVSWPMTVWLRWTRTLSMLPPSGTGYASRVCGHWPDPVQAVTRNAG